MALKQANGQLICAGIFLGAGLGGFADGIVFHQILQWHHMLSATLAPDSLINVKVNMFWDGLFHAAVWLMTVCGLAVLWRAEKPWPGRVFGGSLMMGWGLFNLVEGLVDHQLLGIHHVNEYAANKAGADMAFLAFGLLMLLGGWTLVSKSKIFFKMFFVAMLFGAHGALSAADEDFDVMVKRLENEKPVFAKRQQSLLEARYDLADRPTKDASMSRGKAIQDGVRVRLPKGLSWNELAAMTPDDIKGRNLWPAGFYPLPHPHHETGGMVFPQVLIDETKIQTGRDLTRFDLDFDLPQHFLPEFPAPIYLTTRSDLGDVSQGKLVTLDNYFGLFKDILNPKQLEGLRLLVTPFPQQQFNATDDRKSLKAHQGVSCFDCHANGHTNAATHTVGDIRPNEFRHRIDTPSLRGVYVQRLFGSQRAMKTIEDFTEFEQRAAYFDGDPEMAQKKGVNILERGSQVHFMAEFQALLDFPPAPKLNLFGKLDEAKASESELRGQKLFFGKAQCMTCHIPPYYTDNSMHNLHVERFFVQKMINGRMASADGPIKTFPLRGIKDSPPYLHDDRLLTLDDSVEFFNLVLGLKLETLEKRDLVSFMRAL